MKIEKVPDFGLFVFFFRDYDPDYPPEGLQATLRLIINFWS